MVTVMVVLAIATVLLIVPVWSGYNKHLEAHHPDLMAGDEGDD